MSVNVDLNLGVGTDVPLVGLALVGAGDAHIAAVAVHVGTSPKHLAPLTWKLLNLVSGLSNS